MSNNLHRNQRILLSILCIALGCTVIFLFDDYWAPSRDEQFQTLCVREYNHAPLGLFVFWIGHLWGKVFGFTMINLRILCSIESLLAVGVTSLYLYRRLHRPLLSCWAFLLGCVLLRTSGFGIYNWDSGNYLFDAIALCLLVSIIRKPNDSKYIGLGVTSAMLTLGRLPSVIFLPLSLLIIWISQNDKSLKYRFLSLIKIMAFWFLTMVLLIWFILGSPLHYIELLINGNIVTGHSPTEDSEMLFHRFVEMITIFPRSNGIALTCIVLAALCAIIKARHRLNLYFLIVLWSFMFLLVGAVFPRGITTHIWPLGYDMPLGLGFLLAVPVFNICHKKNIILSKGTKLSLWACFVMFVSMSFGSDAYWERCVSGFIIPLLICLLWPVPRIGFHQFIRYLVLIPTFTFGAAFIGNNYSLWIQTKNEIPITESKVMRGIRGRSFITEEVRKSRDAIKKVSEEGIPYIYLGNHLGSNLEFGPDKGFCFQNYHFQFTYYEYWQRFYNEYFDNVDAVIYLPDFQDYEYDLIVPELKSLGFIKEEKVGDAVILYRDFLRY